MLNDSSSSLKYGHTPVQLQSERTVARNANTGLVHLPMHEAAHQHKKLQLWQANGFTPHMRKDPEILSLYSKL